MSFFKQLSRGANNFFGRQLPRGIARFGGQLGNLSTNVGRGISKVQNVVSQLERSPLGKIPVLGDALRVGNGVLGVSKNITDIGGIGGRGLGAVSRGDWKGAYNAGRGIANEVRDTARLGTQVGANAMKLAPMFL